MKKFIFLLIGFLFVVASGYSQTEIIFGNKVYAADTTSSSATAVYITTQFPVRLLGDPITIQGECTNVSGTSEGTITYEGSIDGTNWEDVNILTYPTGGFSPNDSVTVVDGQGYQLVLPALGHLYLRTKIVGGASDVTTVSQDLIVY